MIHHFSHIREGFSINNWGTKVDFTPKSNGTSQPVSYGFRLLQKLLQHITPRGKRLLFKFIKFSTTSLSALSVAVGTSWCCSVNSNLTYYPLYTVRAQACAIPAALNRSGACRRRLGQNEHPRGTREERPALPRHVFSRLDYIPVGRAGVEGKTNKTYT